MVLAWSPASAKATEVTWYCSVRVETEPLCRMSHTCTKPSLHFWNLFNRSPEACQLT